MNTKHALWIRNIVILACAIDAADKAILAAVYKALSVAMHVGPKELGALTFAENVAFSLALPFWGSMVGTVPARSLMTSGCFIWGMAMLAITLSTDYWVHLVLRLVNGAALAVVNPVGQAIICEIVPEHERGWAFGLLASVNCGLVMVVGFASTAISGHMILGLEGWRWAHLVVALASLLTGVIVYLTVPATVSSASPSQMSWFQDQKRIVSAVLKKPSFVIMVLQGVTGGIPWNGFSFLTFYFQLSGYSDAEAAAIVSYGGAGGIVGGLLGGWLGDHFGALFPNGGRVAVSQCSVALGLLTFVYMMNIQLGAAHYALVTSVFFVFSMVACWTQAAALRPICGELFQDNKDRAQVVALWIALEGLVSSFFGAPMVGVLSEAFGFHIQPGQAVKSTDVAALRAALLGVAVIPWTACFLAWVPMYWTYPRDKRASLGEAAPLKKDKPVLYGEQST
mmetsp:Transcript_72361/g.172419  ORF Transcript_72361/g.172419 Transcript_72361/m.172419 type:complete len:453 (-) Transcript_72361:107-1465(-)|eukprot:CAMPEP_0178440482 /NCGR_PEP_ID=MMETSP0689_2-20121128/36817_1 /TAXON_ID=160604 /ORGANISM="Amphidinium massartii, Strain CS-259" /LENGTH=452 /DNA_ID=CAMNT_0020063289 /DNA_START=69 /DNA_END=1423 /DNA_ORIENTATION=-